MPLCLIVILLCWGERGRAQTSTGTIAGVVLDRSAAAVAGVEVTVTHQQTGFERQLVTSDGGRFAAAVLPPGRYSVEAHSGWLRASPRSVHVQAGMTTALELTLDVRMLTEVATATASALAHDHHQISGWVDRGQIERYPLNGRNVIELAKVEPGITSPARLADGRVFVAPLGAGLQSIPRIGFARITLDGASIETPGSVGSLLRVSPDVVDAMQVSTANFDTATGPATSGAVNVITRSGGNAFRGDAFALYRDWRWSADPRNLTGSTGFDPSVQRRQVGGTLGGPIRRSRAFFFAGFERHTQADAIEVVPTDLELLDLGGMFPSPHSATLFNGRVDVRVTDRHRGVLRHTRDASFAVASMEGPMVLPSGWAQRPVDAHQTMGSLASILTSTIVNELRVSSYFTATRQEPMNGAACRTPCLGLGAPRIILSDGGPGGLTLGNAAEGSQVGRRLQIADDLVWQKGPHLVRAGFDLEHVEHSLSSRDSDPVQLTLWTPEAVRQRDPSIRGPDHFTSLEELLRLPLRSFTTSVGSGDVLQRGFQPVRAFSQVRVHASDRWSLGSRVSVNGGVAWSWESGVLNSDLVKPTWLTPLVGANGLRLPAADANLAGTLGVTWRVSDTKQTVVRVGAGHYVESLARTVALNLANERVLLSPLGTGRMVVSGSNLTWNGRRLNFPAPTTFTGADLLAILPDVRASIAQSLSPGNRDFSVLNIDRAKEGRNLYDPSYGVPQALHASIGVEREVADRVVVSADVVWKRFANAFINGIDYNRFFSARGPVIRACAANEREDVTAVCSNGSLFFDTTSGEARYRGLLLRIEKRFSGPARILASYALGSFVGSNGTGTGTSETAAGRVFGFNLDDWSENYGPLPTDIRHVLNLSGVLDGPGGVNVSLNLSAYSRPPFSAYVAGMDFNGDGTVNDLLPGTRVNAFNRGLTRDDLVRLVQSYNEQTAGRFTAGGQRAPFVTLPDEFAFNDSLFTVDLRLARTFGLGRSVRLTAFADLFNLLNTMNLVGYSGNLAAPSSFGQPTGRVGQAFGSGGPRAVQVGMRLGF